MSSNHYDPIYNFLLDNVLDKINISNIFVKGLWKIDLFFNPDPRERTFKYTILVSQTSNDGQGAAYCSHDETISVRRIHNLVGNKVNDILFDESLPYCLKISILDSLYESLKQSPDYTVLIEGSSRKKAYYRAEIIINEVIVLLYKKIIENKIKNTNPTILNIGFVSMFQNILYDKIHSIRFFATDLHKDIINKVFNNIKILNGKEHNIELLEKSDIALVTGMTLSTSTLYDILNYAKRYNTDVVIFAETGYNLSPYYINFGANVIISEEFPYYIFNGISRLRIYRKH